MAENEHSRSSESIHVTVLRARRLKGVKGDVLTSYAKVEFDGKSLGDSAKVDSTAEVSAEYNFTTSFDCSFSDGHHTLDDVASKPLLITVTEVLPKEKKQKEEKSAVLGQCTVDLLPLLLQPESEITNTLILHAVPGSPLETVTPEFGKVEIDIKISVNEPLLDGEHLTQSNLFTVRLGSAYSLPDSWSSGSHYNYIVGLPVPVTSEKQATVIFQNGALKSSADKEPSKRSAKWYSVPNAVSAAQFIPNSQKERVSYEEEKGDFSGKEFSDFRNEAETEKNRISWDVEKRCYLDPDAKAEFQNKISQTRYWPVEVMRNVPSQSKVPAAAGSKKDKNAPAEDDGHISFHGVVYVDLAPLLYPGVCSVAGAFAVHPFNESELKEKTKRTSAVAEDIARVQSSTSRGTGSSPVLKGKGTKEGSTAVSKKGSAVKHAESTAEVDGSQQTNTDSLAYTESRSYLYLEFTLARPFVPRREPEELAAMVREYIPPRPAFKRAVGGAAKAVEDYHAQLASVASMVLDEFREMFGEEIGDDALNQTEAKRRERKKQLMYQLNSSGKYFAFKEQLKHSVVKIVREKYMKTTTFKSKDELQAFLSDLYVYLIDEMHAAFGKLLSMENEPQEVIEPMVDSFQLKRFAQEAEVNEEYKMASKYYQERLAMNEKNPEHWFDYGTFNLLVGDNSKAKECFKETVAIDQTYKEGLLMYGIMCTMDECYTEAETVLERSTSLVESSPDAIPQNLAWTILALFYDSQGNEIQAEHAYSQANKLNIAAAVEAMANTEAKEEDAKEVAEKPDPGSVVGTEQEQAASLLPSTGSNTKPQPPGSAKSVSTVRGTTKASTKKDSRIRSSTENSVSSHDQDAKQKPSEAESKVTAVPKQTIFMQAAQWLLRRKALKFAEISLSHELLEPHGGPSAEYYIALAQLQMMRRQLSGAKESLELATSFDNEHPDAWAMMGHFHYVSGDYISSKSCYERTLAFVTDAAEMHSIYLRLASIYLQQGEFQNAKRTYLLACKHSPTCISWLGVGIACYRLNEISEAEDALAEANILNNTNSDVWAYLSLVCLNTGRKLEAEQAYKYAMKIGFDDENVIEEIHSVQKKLGFGNPSY
ncbi:cilia- and flagella-associated protein 70 [Ciona intestinalis]